jgi:pimeloyl-ACP methyl ester carboxylesterase
MEKVKCHTYILHGTKDWLIPISSSEKLAAIAPERTTLIRIEGGKHNNLPSFPQYHAFLRDILLY